MATQSDNTLKLPDRVKRARQLQQRHKVMGTAWEGFNAAVDKKLAQYQKAPAPRAPTKP